MIITRHRPDSSLYPRLLFFVNAALPALLLGWDTLNERLGTNPQEYLIRTTGMLTLILMVVTLTISPLVKLTRQPAIMKVRRMAGLFTFFYASLHALSYSWFDKELDLGLIITDLLRRPFIFLGMAAFILIVPLALTSTNRMVRLLGGRRWKMLHRIVYASAIAGSIHYYLLVRADKRLPLVFAASILLLLVWRWRGWSRRIGQP
jgi:sulfoxide reductase heme-binding subunit YedZ